MADEIKLKPCAFCAGQADFYENAIDFEPVWGVRCCGECEALQDSCVETKEEAAEIWNTRVSVPVETEGSSLFVLSAGLSKRDLSTTTHTHMQGYRVEKTEDDAKASFLLACTKIRPGYSIDEVLCGRVPEDVFASMVQLAIAEITVERDDADRRAGAAERKLEDVQDTLARQNQWRDAQKRSRGYDTNVSFDVVWGDTCKLADQALKATEA